MAVSGTDMLGFFRSMNANWSSRIFALAFAAICVYGYVNKSGSKKPEDCTYFKEQNSQLVQALLEIKKSVNDIAAQSTSFIDNGYSNEGFIFASYDTIKRPVSQMQERQRLYAISRKIDSLLLKERMDSLKRKQ